MYSTLKKIRTTLDYALTGMHVGKNWRSKLLLASMLPRLKIHHSLGMSCSNVYAVDVLIGEMRRILYLREQDIFILHEILAYSPYLLPDLNENPPHCIVDLGAHIGLATLRFKADFPDAYIHCYEPDPENFELLRMNTMDLHQVILNHVAAGPEAKRTTFYVNQKHHAASSLVSNFRSDDIFEVECTVNTLDGILDSIESVVDLIKFDIEGSEFHVFTNSKCIDKVKSLIGEIKATKQDLEEFIKIFPNHYATIKYMAKNMYLIYLRHRDAV